MNKEIYLKEAEQIKEVLTNMPQNNKINKKKYLSYLKETLDKYSQMKESLIQKIKDRNETISKKEVEEEKDYDKAEEQKKQILEKLLILNDKNDPYEKIGLDKIIFSINKYYEGNLEILNDEIKKGIKCFDTVGITLTKEDFWYSEYLNEYMHILLGNNDNGEVKQKLNEIYWKSPNIINQIAMNLNNLYYKYEKSFIEYYKKQKEEILSNNSKEKLLEDYNKLCDTLNNRDYLIHNLSQKIITGEDNIKDFSEDKYQTYIETFSQVELEKESLDKLSDTLYEYSMYNKYKFMIDEYINIYKEKDKYKNAYKNLLKEINKEEGKVRKINKKIIFQKKWKKDLNKIEMLKINLNNSIEVLKEKYSDLQIQKINEMTSKYTDNLSYYDILWIISTHYVYLRKILSASNESISDKEINSTQIELYDLLLNNRLTILDNISVLDNSNIPNTISNIYKLLNIKIEESDIEANLDSYIETLRKIRVITAINNSPVTYDELLFQSEAQNIINS